MRWKQDSAIAVAAITAAIGTTAAIGPSAVASPSQQSDLTPQTTSLSSQEQTLLASGQPVDVLLDPTTDQVISVTPAPPPQVSPQISNHGVCDAGNGCYSTDTVPYASQGFYGTAGTKSGNWPDRNAYSAGDYTVSACWSGACGITIGPGSTVHLTEDETGTSFTIH